MKIVNFTAAWVGILVAPLMVGATPTLSTPTVSPVYAAVNVKTQFTASCKLNTASGDPTPLAAGINLVRLTSAGADVAVLGVMHDDGLNGDAAAGDGIFTLQFSSTETSIGSFQLQCDGAFPSQVRRVQSPVVSVAALIAPSVTSLSTTPASPIAGQAFSLNVVGANFDPASAQIVINGPNCTPCVLANGALTTKSATSVAGSATLVNGAYTVAVRNTATTAISGTLALTVGSGPSVTSLSTTPSTPVATQAFSLTVAGANFDPASAILVITGTGCSPCTVANSALTAKSATSVTGPATLATAGSYTVAVQNGASGPVSGTLALTVAALPTLTSLSTTPSTAIGGQAFSLAIVGTSFDPASATILINGPSCSPCTVANSALTAKSATSITGPATLGGGSFTVAVQNTATGATSATLALTVATPPALTSLSTTPSTAIGGQALSLTIVGTGFDAATATIVINGPGCSPCTVANSALTAKSATSITGPATLGGGSFTIAVQNTATGATSGTLPLSVVTPPVLTSLSTTPSTPIASQAFSITVVGTGFDPATAQIIINGPSCTPCTIANSALTAKSATSVTGSTTLANGAYSIAVQNTATTATSGTLPLTVGSGPAVTSLSTTPATPIATQAFSLTIVGTNFDPATATIVITGPSCSPCTVANSALTAKSATSITGPATLGGGSFTVAVQNTASGATSGTLALTVVTPPALTSLSTTPATPIASQAFSLTIVGTSFDPATATIVINGPSCTPCTVANSALTAKSATSVTGPATLGSGSYTVAVQNTATGASSGTLALTVGTAPALTSLSTTPATAIGGQAFSVTIVGTNFDPATATIVINGPSCTPCTVANSALTAKSATSITGPATLGAGSFTIAVQNTATSATSGTLPLTVATPPALTSLSTTPATPLASQAFSLTIVGTGFDTATATIVITGPSCTPCTVANSALTAKSATSITGPATLGAGSFTVAVQNTATGATSGTSLALTVGVVPTLTSLSTTPAPPVGGQAFSLTIVGTNFDPATATLAITGPSCTPCTVANSALTAKSATSLTGPATLGNGSFTVAVVNTATGASSGTLPLAVGGTPPTITSLSTTPTTPVAANSFSFIITGTNFVPTTSQVLINGPGCAPCTILNGSLSGATATQISGSTTLGSSGSFAVAVQNGTSGLTSGTVALTMAAPPAPTITSFTPASATIGSTVTVTGTNLVAGTTAATMSLAAQAGGTLTAPLASATATSLMFVIPAGTATGTVTAALVGQTATSSGTLTITPSSTFTLSTTPASATVIKGQTVSYSVQMASTNGFSQLAPLAISGLPSGVTAAFKPASISAGQTSILTLTAPTTQAVATSTLTVSAAATVDGLPVSQTTTASLAVTAPTTSFLGRTVVADPAETPLVGVAVSMVGQDGSGNATGCTGKTTSDAAGNFALTTLAANCVGPQLVAFDGNSVTSPVGTYAGLQLVFTLVSGSVVVSPVLVHLPIINTAETFSVIQNDTVDQSYTFKTIPGLKITVYAGTTFTKQDGTKPDPFPLAAIEVPVDRLPDVMPTTTAGVGAFIVAFQPAESNASAPVAVWYPNTLNTAPGTNVPLMTLDPTKGRMVPYGTGTISTDGTTITPDVDPSTGTKQQRYGITHFDWHGPLAGPPNQADPTPGLDNPSAGEPVDLASGVDVITSTDISFAGDRGSLSLTRTYRTLAAQGPIPGPFGWGSYHNFEYRLDTLSPQSAAVINLILPSGTRIPFTLQADGTLTNTTVPMVAGWVMVPSSNGTTTLTMKGGTYYQFVPGIPPTGSVLVAIGDPNGNITTIVRQSGQPQLIAEIDDPVGRKLLLEYSGYNVTKVTDPIGRAASYTYNSAGYLATFTNVLGGVTTYQYDSQGRLTKITDPHGATGTNTYDANGRVASQTLPSGGTMSYGYTLVNPLVPTSPITQTTVTDSLGNVTIYRFSTQGFVIGVTDAAGQTRKIARQSGSNRILSMAGSGTCPVCGDTKSGDVSFTYDARGNMLTKTDSLGNTWTFTYEPAFDHIASVADPMGNVATCQYDTRGNLVKITDALGGVVAFTRDGTGLITSVKDPAGNRTNFAYDSVGNLVASTNPLGQKTQFSYDAVSRLVARMSALGRTSALGFNAGDETTAITDPSGHSTLLAYDGAGLISFVTDPNGGKTTIKYDAAGRVASRVDQLGRILSYQYDLNNNLVGLTNRRGLHVAYSYNSLNRLVSETYSDATVQRSYDSYGRIVSIVDSQSGTFSMTYDLTGRLVRMVGPTGSLSYTRDALGRVVSRQVNGQAAAKYAYDANGNLVSATLGSASVGYTYDARNLVIAAARSNGVAGSYAFDSVGRLASISETFGTSVLLSRTFSYDADDEISAASADLGLPLSTSAAVGVFDAANEVTSFGSANYTTDADGNRLTETSSVGTTSYAWDARGRLQSIQSPAGAVTSMVYDPAGQMIQKRTKSAGQDITERYVVDDVSNVVSIQQGDSIVTSVLDGRHANSVIAMVQGASTVFPLHDQVGSSTVYADATGNVAQHGFYEPFGAQTVAGSVTISQFAGMSSVSGGLYYDRARYYDSTTGRFLSEDPLGILGGGANGYSYVGNSPINRIDPTGLVDVNIVDKTDGSYTEAQAYNSWWYFTIAGHGNPADPNHIYTKSSDDGKPVSVKDVGEQIIKHGWDPEVPIRAIICEGTKGGDDKSFDANLAQYLANKTGAPVTIQGSPNDVNVTVYQFAGFNVWSSADPGAGGWHNITKTPQNRP